VLARYQVLGGRWKPLHHWYKSSIFADVMATCGVSGGPDAANTTLAAPGAATLCYVKNDSPKPFDGKVTVNVVDFASGVATAAKSLVVTMPAGAGVTEWFSVDKEVDGTKEMLLITVESKAGEVLSTNPVAFTTPEKMMLPKATVTATAAAQQTAAGPVEITVKSDKFALYVTLTTLAQGRFEDNAFAMLPGTKTLKFYPFAGFEMAELTASLRVEHTALYA
jgi:hypothetical protein